ncbi:MAG: N-acetylneuraminate synthase family protein [Candidatus Omnitrophica bacterium]|nr:N-acetylneuraminate synthase family protein [Candidatus Omnitrophota bacterium]
MQKISLGPYSIGSGCRPLVIAEAGINHNGDIDIALEMIRIAHEAGADVVKFQTHCAEAEMLPDKGIGNDAGSHVTRSLFDIMRECELSYENHRTLKKEAERLGILFLSTPFSIEAVDLLEKVNVVAYKIGSGEVTNVPFLRYVAQKGKPIILSTGTATWDEVRLAVESIKDSIPGVVLMQCTSNYPTAYENVNLGVIEKMHNEFQVPVGLSDHCVGNYACFGAVAKGACMVEKHFTLSRTMPGIDQQSSIEPHELKDLVTGVRAVWAARGDVKELNEEALKVRHGFSESIVTIASVKKGERFKEHQNVWVKRPGSGIPSYELPKIVGKRAIRDLPAEYLLTPDDMSDR